MTVHNVLGPGFLEKVYERAMVVELGLMKIGVRAQHPLDVFYKGVDVGDYSCDLFVEGTLVVELKAVKVLPDTAVPQTVNYLKATDQEVALLFNFGRERLEWKRLLLDS